MTSMSFMKASVVVIALMSCSKLPFKRNNQSSPSGPPSPPGENEVHWNSLTPVASLPGFRAFATSQPAPDARPAASVGGSCGAPAKAHVITAELNRDTPGHETIYVTTHGVAAVSNGQVVAATAAPTDCAQLGSEIVVAYAGHWHRGSSFPHNENRVVVVERFGTQVRQRLYYHHPRGRLTDSFSWVIEDSATPELKRSVSIHTDGDQLFTEAGPYHWVAEEARFVKGQKMSRAERKSF
jgi:hypothetical protein